MESEFNLHTEVRLADLLALLEANTCQAYLCHYVAYYLRFEIAKHPEYQDYFEKAYVPDADDTYTQQRNTAIPYYFLVRDDIQIRHYPLQEQIIPQFYSFMLRYRPELEQITNPYLMSLSENTMRKFYLDEPVSEAYRMMDPHECRLGMVRKILEHDPDAVLTIKL